MSQIVTIKHGKKKHKNVEIKSDENFADIQAIIYSLTSVEPQRQKIIIKGKQITNFEEIQSIFNTNKVKNGIVLTVMGSIEKKVNENEINNNISKFFEDLPDSEKQKTMFLLPPGLQNLGNTCYLNSCLQCIKSIKELKNELIQSANNNNNQNNQNNNNNNDGLLSNQLRNLFQSMDSSSESIVPSTFVQWFRTRFPEFASRNNEGVWEQQDADEAYTKIISLLNQENPNIISNLFQGCFESKTICNESNEEPVDINNNENFIKLQCFIDINTRHINDGIAIAMKEEIEKNSSKLGRNAMWTKTKKISKLPKYLPIQLVRFFWKEKKQKNAKILRRVVFPEKLDMFEFCSDELKKVIENYRNLKLKKEDIEREKKHGNNNNNNNNNNNDNNNNNNNNNNNQNKDEKEDKMDVDVVDDNNNNNNNNNQKYETGDYELVALVTHKGRSANSGHYIGYAKDDTRNKWLKFDDDYVEVVNSEDIKNLYGGGDWQMCFLCFYRKIEPKL